MTRIKFVVVTWTCDLSKLEKAVGRANASLARLQSAFKANRAIQIKLKRANKCK